MQLLKSLFCCVMLLWSSWLWEPLLFLTLLFFFLFFFVLPLLMVLLLCVTTINVPQVYYGCWQDNEMAGHGALHEHRTAQ